MDQKVVPNPVVAPAVTWIIAGASHFKDVIGGVRKTASAAPKRCVDVFYIGKNRVVKITRSSSKMVL
jgi:hypothetical protein